MNSTRQRSDTLGLEYRSRVNRVIDHIYAQPGREFTLAELAGIACFSAFHFHRIFSAMVGETLYDFIRRIRLERAAASLVVHPGLSITEVALESGFSSPSLFARSFRDRFGCSASEWRHGIGRRRDAGVTMEQGDGAAAIRPQAQRDDLVFGVEVKELPPMTVAYVRHVGAFHGMGEAFGRLARWAGPRGHLAADALVLAVYHDSPGITAESNLRSDACVRVPEGTGAEGEIGLLQVPGGRFAVAGFDIDPTQFGAAWNALMGGWLPSSGYQPDDRMCYEIYRSMPGKEPGGHFLVDICVPVRPL